MPHTPAVSPVCLSDTSEMPQRDLTVSSILYLFPQRAQNAPRCALATPSPAQLHSQHTPSYAPSAVLLHPNSPPVCPICILRLPQVRS